MNLVPFAGGGSNQAADGSADEGANGAPANPPINKPAPAYEPLRISNRSDSVRS